MTGPSKQTRDFLLRGLPVELADKLRVAASLHKQASLRAYLVEVLGAHVKDLERKGFILMPPKGK